MNSELTKPLATLSTAIPHFAFIPWEGLVPEGGVADKGPSSRALPPWMGRSWAPTPGDNVARSEPSQVAAQGKRGNQNF